MKRIVWLGLCGLCSCLIYNEDLLLDEDDDGVGGSGATGATMASTTSSAGGGTAASTSTSSTTAASTTTTTTTTSAGSSSSSASSSSSGAGGMMPVAVWINELHYNNAGGDADEGVEIAGTAGADLTNYEIVLYNGATSQTYRTFALSGVIPNQQGTGFGALWFPESSIQNGDPDGLALLDDLGQVVQFLSYGGTFTASDGPALGMVSVDIGVVEDDTTAVGTSLQLSGMGMAYADFTWQAPAAATRGLINNGQTF
ncbi:MAG: hypothetical protein AAF928_15945 [Myxococcota bacterium]